MCDDNIEHIDAQQPRQATTRPPDRPGTAQAGRPQTMDANPQGGQLLRGTIMETKAENLLHLGRQIATTRERGQEGFDPAVEIAGVEVQNLHRAPTPFALLMRSPYC